MNQVKKPLHAVIGVRFDGNRTFFVQRSEKMENYPRVWSLFSERISSDDLMNPRDLKVAQTAFDRMGEERLMGTPVTVKRYILSDDTDKNPINTHVFLHLYEIEFSREPMLNPDFYLDTAWLTLDEYLKRANEKTCGSCIRMWWDYAWMNGLTENPFPGTVTKA